MDNNVSVTKEIPKITRGNDFNVRVLVTRAVPSDEGTKQENIDLVKCNSIIARRVTRLGRRITMDCSVDGSYVVIPFEEDVPSGSYGLEVAGKYPNGQDWRFFLKPGEFLDIVEATSDSDTDGATVKDVYDYSAVVLGESLSEAQLTELTNAAINANAAADEASSAAASASENAGKAAEVVAKAESAAASANDAASKANKAVGSVDSKLISVNDAEAIRAEAEKERISAENQRDIHEQQRLQSEAQRVSSEKTRVTNESDRQTAETARVEAETKRVSAENQRSTEFGSLKTAADNATSAANDAAERANKAVDAVESKVKETLTITLSCNHDENITGKKIYVKNSEDDSVLEEHEWQGETIKTSVMPDKKYYVECDAMEGYSTPKSDKYTAISGNVRELSLAYESEWFYPTVLMEDGTDAGSVNFEMVYSIMGERVQMKYTAGMVIKVPYGTKYQMVCSSKAGYYSGIFSQRVAKETEYHASTTYKVAQTQIGIQMADGTIVSADDWDDTKYDSTNVNGILVCATGIQCVMAVLEPFNRPFGWGKIDGCDMQTDSTLIKGQLGEANTKALVDGGANDASTAAGYCYNTVLKSGKHCYLPALDEARALYANRAEINKCSQKLIEKDIMVENQWKWSSTMKDASYAWCFYSTANTYSRINSYACIPVSAL